MKTKIIILAAFIISTLAFADQVSDSTSNTLTKIVTDHSNAFEKEDIDLMMSFVHPQSPHYRRAKKALSEHFKEYDTEIHEFSISFIGVDEDFSFVRTKQIFTTTLVGQKPVTKESSSLQVFKKDDGIWKIWESVFLGSKAPKK